VTPAAVLGLRRKPSVLPGFGLTLGFSLLYLGLIVLIPLAALFVRARPGWAGRSFWPPSPRRARWPRTG
jgi:sulfate/thiosulfate transport system permease protein